MLLWRREVSAIVRSRFLLRFQLEINVRESSALSNHLACGHLTALDVAVAASERAPPDWHSPGAVVLQQRGIEHERAYLAHLEASGIPVTDLRDIESDGDSLAPVVSGAWRHRTDPDRDEAGGGCDCSGCAYGWPVVWAGRCSAAGRAAVGVWA
jgi:hypothetical protein